MSAERQTVVAVQPRRCGSGMESVLLLLAGTERVCLLERSELVTAAASLANSDAVALMSASPREADILKGFGFLHVRAYRMLPTVARPRWVFPSGKAGRRAVEEYVPHRLSGELLSIWMRTALLRNGPFLVIASRRMPVVEQELAARLGQEVQLAYSLGTPGAYNKVTATVLDGELRVIAFAKIATLPFAQAATLHEEQILRSLENCSPIREHVPRVIDSFELKGARILVTSSGPNRRAPKRYGVSHSTFLQILSQQTARNVRFEDSSMWRNMQSAFAGMEDKLDSVWGARLRSALELLHRELGDSLLPMGLAHGDFAPWNTRSLSDGSLYLFDWEFARLECTPLYDQFHFEFVVRLLLQRRRWTVPNLIKYLRSIQPDGPVRVSLLFLAFLTDLTLFYFLAMHRRGEDRVLPEEVVLLQAGYLLDTWKVWL